MYQYRINIHRIIDGDTVDVDIDLGFGVWLKKQRIRLYGIDTPESRTRDLDEKRYGLRAKKYLTQQIEGGAILKTRLDKKGKYGRILGEFISLDGNTNINELMISKHHAVSYHGASKAEIAEGHLRNRTRVKEI